MCKGNFVTAGLIVGFNIWVPQIWRWYHGTAEQLEWLNDWLLGEFYIYTTKYGAGIMEQLGTCALNDWLLAETYLRVYTITCTVM